MSSTAILPDLPSTYFGRCCTAALGGWLSTSRSLPPTAEEAAGGAGGVATSASEEEVAPTACMATKRKVPPEKVSAQPICDSLTLPEKT
jgi:hypothetical protein